MAPFETRRVILTTNDPYPDNLLHFTCRVITEEFNWSQKFEKPSQRFTLNTCTVVSVHSVWMQTTEL